MDVNTVYKSVTHISLLDDNPLSALTPLLDPNIPSHRVIFAIKPTQKNAVTRITRVIKPKGIKVSSWVLPETTNTGDLSRSFHQLISSTLRENPTEQLILNTSCGNRHSVLSAFEVAKQFKLHCFVVEPKLDELYWLHPAEKSNTKLAESLKITGYLSALNVQIKSIANQQTVQNNITNIGAKWCSEPRYYAQALGTLNYLAYTADNYSLTSTPLTVQQQEDTALRELISDLTHLHYVRLENDTLVFKNNEARFFANGGWLEEYVYGIILALKKDIPTIQDAAQGVEITRHINDEFTVNNELDVATLTNNKLHLIECKTKKFKRGEGNNVLYKLDSLDDLLGDLYARAMLVSFKNIRIAEQYRAQELNIKILGPEELPNLRKHLAEWLRNA